MNFEIFIATAPGLEDALFEEMRGKGFKNVKIAHGGVTFHGGWPDVWRANLWVRGASKILARITSFNATHLSQLEKNTAQVNWIDFLRPEHSFCVDVSCSKSKIYHSGAAEERIERAIAKSLGVEPSKDADIKIMGRIHRDICTLSIDTSGELLHKRGFRVLVNKAPMRQNMASLFLMECGYSGREPVYDPMCGSGTFVIEAAEISARLNPGRGRAFAFEKLRTFDRKEWDKMLSVKRNAEGKFHFYGSDRDEGAVKMSVENAARAGVGDIVEIKQCVISDIIPPSTIPGLVIINPPYGKRIGDRKKLLPLYQSMGKVLRERFSGWRVGMVTTDKYLADATGLEFLPTKDPVQHGGLRVTLYRTNPLP